ncbi:MULTISPECIES: cystathionine beta-lyase [unclassified Modicisalibacter]|uniref:cystathionine beta-lyase n=1 Tax=unclassified Modicisalibacter TaxID=2679913 RepID=UPI001CCA5356|nr:MULTISPECIES: cystathionine beta-lyase [unclassified Modicisalibacter]MBZ9558320.1 cystathionine beta-lyase [Modicisalibacter sp. R2A 31.J]MBZ9575788.1 cystathionine beta-lyase [Modicisalibacter sp. MOD 31.J]
MKLTTDLIHLARPGQRPAPVNPPVVRTSTVTFSTLAEMRDTKQRRANGERLFSYGRRGTPTTHALEDAISRLENGEHTQLLPSGVAAINLVFMTLLQPGAHVVIADSVYQPVRRIVEGWLRPWGIAVDYFDGTPEHLSTRLRAETRLIYTEVPGSLVYEMQDLPALAAMAAERDIPLAVDNTWSSGLLMRPLEHGATISLMACTKYVVGHSDVMLGSVTANGELGRRLAEMAATQGQCIGGDDAYLALRGVRTLACRMATHADNARQLGDWLSSQPHVARVHQPSRAEHPGHGLWQRDFDGTNGLLTVEFTADTPPSRVDALVDSLALFGIGSSWGGFESLALPCDLAAARSLDDSWSRRGPCLRLHAGLEAVDDLRADLERAWTRLDE